MIFFELQKHVLVKQINARLASNRESSQICCTYARDQVLQPVVPSGTFGIAEISGPCVVDPDQQFTGLAAAAQERRKQVSCMLNTDAD